jgi:menaquinone-dependent protoporphyrinogen oxidase
MGRRANSIQAAKKEVHMTDAKRKVLVAYGTRAGSAAGVAERVADVLNRTGFEAQAVDVSKVKVTAPYDAVVLGSSVRAGKLKPEVLKFLDKNKADLSAKPFAAFVVCLAMTTNDEKGRTTAGTYLAPVRERIRPLSEGLFAGAYDPKKLDLISRQIMKMIKAPAGDFRRWDEIEAWAAGLVPLFSARP